MIRPKKIVIEDNIITAELFYKRNTVDNKGEMTDILIFPTLQFTQKNKVPLILDSNMFTKELGLKFNGYTYGIGKLVRIAEISKDKLDYFIESYFEVNQLEEFYNKNKNCEKLKEYKIEENIKNLPYATLVNILRCIIKYDTKYHLIEEFSTKDKRSKYRKSFMNYVEDRNDYTHGILFFEYPKFNPILRIKNTKGKSYYINYSKEIFISNQKTFNYLYDVLNKMIEITKTD